MTTSTTGPGRRPSPRPVDLEGGCATVFDVLLDRGGRRVRRGQVNLHRLILRTLRGGLRRRRHRAGVFGALLDGDGGDDGEKNAEEDLEEGRYEELDARERRSVTSETYLANPNRTCLFADKSDMLEDAPVPKATERTSVGASHHQARSIYIWEGGKGQH